MSRRTLPLDEALYAYLCDVSLREPPVMRVRGPAAALAQRMGVERIFLSITHDAGVAAAVVILEGDVSASAPRPSGAAAQEAPS